MTKLRYGYVLVTPARNEESTIGITIDSVVRQSELPREWVIVSDQSTDRTDEIVSSYAKAHPWIRLLRLENRPTRNFGSVVYALESGIRHLDSRDYEYIGFLDADVRFDSEYFNQLIREFVGDESLGLIGGMVIDVGTDPSEKPLNLLDVPGAAQFFRRSCFESLGHLIAVPEGGWDALTCAVARMNGFRTRLLKSVIVEHLKPRNVHLGGIHKRKWEMGKRDYALGYHPLFELFKCCRRVAEPPILTGALFWLAGYLVTTVVRRGNSLPPKLVNHIRQEQLARMRTEISRLFRFG